MTTSAGKWPGRTGNAGRHRWGAAPIAASRLFTSDRCSISSSATRPSERRQRSIAASSVGVTPSLASRFNDHCAYRYEHITVCSNSAASHSR